MWELCIYTITSENKIGVLFLILMSAL